MNLANLPWGDYEYLELAGDRFEAVFLFGLLCEANENSAWPDVDAEWNLDYDTVIIYILHMDVWEVLDFLRILCENEGITVYNDSDYAIQQPLPLWQEEAIEDEEMSKLEQFCRAFIW